MDANRRYGKTEVRGSRGYTNPRNSLRSLECCVEPIVTIDSIGPQYVVVFQEYGPNTYGYWSLDQWSPRPCPSAWTPVPGPDVIKIKVSLPSSSIGKCRVAGGNIFGWITPSLTPGSGSYVSQALVVPSGLAQNRPYPEQTRRGASSAVATLVVRPLCLAANVNTGDTCFTRPLNSGFGIASSSSTMSIGFASCPLSYGNQSVQGLFNVGVLTDLNQVAIYTYDFFVKPKPYSQQLAFYSSQPPVIPTPWDSTITLNSIQTFDPSQISLLFGETSAAIATQELPPAVGNQALVVSSVNRLGVVGMEAMHRCQIETTPRPPGLIIQERLARMNGMPAAPIGIWSDPSGFQYPRDDLLPDVIGVGGLDGRNVAFFPGIS